MALPTRIPMGSWSASQTMSSVMSDTLPFDLHHAQKKFRRLRRKFLTVALKNCVAYPPQLWSDTRSVIAGGLTHGHSCLAAAFSCAGLIFQRI
jgi:hypothetical protein